jgi:hypothetical protein
LTFHPGHRTKEIIFVPRDCAAFGKEGLSVISFLIEIDLATGVGASKTVDVDKILFRKQKRKKNHLITTKEIGQYRRRKRKRRQKTIEDMTKKEEM